MIESEKKIERLKDDNRDLYKRLDEVVKRTQFLQPSNDVRERLYNATWKEWVKEVVRALSEFVEAEVPNFEAFYLDPVMREFVLDPVVAVMGNDVGEMWGTVYDRDSIIEWEKHCRHPLTDPLTR